MSLALAVSACSAPHGHSTVTRPIPAHLPAHPTAAPGMWKLKWRANFSESANQGSFSGCNNYAGTVHAYCSGLPAGLRSQWWAYPYPWPDTATEQHRRLGGYYDPSHTVWISGNQMHIRMFRVTSWIHAAAVLPKAAIGMVYGKYMERFRVTPGSSPGYKSAHLLWPTTAPLGDEVDFPEGPWNSSFCVFVHSVHETTQRNFCPGLRWTSWHTSEIEWTPHNLTFYLDGREIGAVTGIWVPHQPMAWIIQNESALGGEQAPDHSSAQINISSVAVYSYQGKEDQTSQNTGSASHANGQVPSAMPPTWPAAVVLYRFKTHRRVFDLRIPEISYAAR